MEIDIERFRTPLIDALRAARAQHPDAHLHLLYSPELADPLALIGDTRREAALINPPVHNVPIVEPPKENRPRLITLDCLRVAPYLLETDAALDDPLFEASVSQAVAETALQQRPDTELENDEPVLAEFAIGGWLLTRESAADVASRIHRYSYFHAKEGLRAWIRWTNPVYLNAMWPTLKAEQKQMLLGEAVWLVFDAAGQLRRYASNDPTASVDANETVAPKIADRILDAQQTQLIKNMLPVRDLLARWQTLCEARGERLPNDAEQQLHALLGEAQRYALDADSVTLYVLTAVQLKPSATEDAEWIACARNAGSDGLPLRDRIEHLSDDFWQRWSRPLIVTNTQAAQATDQPKQEKSA